LDLYINLEVFVNFMNFWTGDRNLSAGSPGFGLGFPVAYIISAFIIHGLVSFFAKASDRALFHGDLCRSFYAAAWFRPVKIEGASIGRLMNGKAIGATF
jgi:hypothetical protein